MSRCAIGWELKLGKVYLAGCLALALGSCSNDDEGSGTSNTDTVSGDSSVDGANDIGEDQTPTDGGDDSGDDPTADVGGEDADDDAVQDIPVDLGGEDGANDVSDATEDATVDTALDVGGEDGSGDADSCVQPGNPEYDGGLAADQCRDTDDCDDLNEMCFRPDSPFCGMPPEGEPCATSEECLEEGTTCRETLPWECTMGGGLECLTACTGDDFCREGRFCDLGTGVCERTACADDCDCPRQFHCDREGDAPVCRRRTCADDDACNDGYCVGGRCYDTPGFCSPLPA